jgi:glycyl-tRNA synthetase alpha subunit
MNIEIYLDDQQLDIKNISVADFNQKTQEIKDNFSKTELDFSSINYLKGNKKLLEKSFQNQKAESLNL